MTGETGVKPCPFCGNKVLLKFQMGDWGYTSDTVSIRCDKCNVGFLEDTQEWKQGVGTYSIREQAEEKLLKKWNTRSC